MFSLQLKSSGSSYPVLFQHGVIFEGLNWQTDTEQQFVSGGPTCPFLQQDEITRNLVIRYEHLLI